MKGEIPTTFVITNPEIIKTYKKNARALAGQNGWDTHPIPDGILSAHKSNLNGGKNHVLVVVTPIKDRGTKHLRTTLKDGEHSLFIHLEVMEQLHSAGTLELQDPTRLRDFDQHSKREKKALVLEAKRVSDLGPESILIDIFNGVGKTTA